MSPVVERATHIPARSESLTVRGLRYNLRKWGRPDARPILFLHGTQDSSITFQFVVDQLRQDWCAVAPDWRGHGHSQWVRQGYWLHELLADLDAIMDALFPSQSVPLVGHSLGGNVAGVYAGLKPDRVTHLISLDGFGPLTNLVPVDVRQILSRLLATRTADRQHVSYPSLDEVAARLKRGNLRLSRENALFLAEHLTTQDAQGGWRWRFDPSHQATLPSLHSIAEWGDIWSGIRAPALWVSSQDKRPFAATTVPGELDRRAAMMPEVVQIAIPNTGHNLHHDEPARVAELIERFVADPTDLASPNKPRQPVAAPSPDPATADGSARSRQ
jgi:pimeloyl-ACP methyl ester carboxylesterase